METAPALSMTPQVISFYAMPFGLDPQITFYCCLALGLLLICLAVVLKRRLRSLPAAKATEATADRDRLVVLVGHGEKIIESGIPGVFISLDKFFRDIGFSVIVTEDLRRLERILKEGAPVIMGIDCAMGPKPLRKVDSLCQACFGVRAAVAFFYNAAKPETLQPPANLPQATYLGESFTSLQVLELISYAISVDAHAPRPSGSLREGSTLEGRNIGHALVEILQFLEVGRRTGLLSVEDGLPAGIISFEQGNITFAQTRLKEGLEAVMEILAVTGGTFHFFDHKRVMQSNCRISPQEALMQWACRVDESGKAVPGPFD